MSVRSFLATEPKALSSGALALAVSLLPACGRSGEHAGARKGEPLRVAAAADLAIAFEEVGKAFEAESGKKVEFTFGSSGLLAKQIEQGAPFDVFAAANVSFVDDAIESGACNGASKQLYAEGRIVVWAKDKNALPKDVTELANPKYSKIAIANPEHAPYGRAAQQALAKSGAWASVQGRAVYGENVQQTLMFAQSGNADVAIVALSLAMNSGGSWVPVDPSLHEPLKQALVVCKGGPKGAKPEDARAFAAFVASDAGRAIMKKHGFTLPSQGESTGSP
ncbi:Molybdenum ABC transporter, periplasmic molybdenum-binding protein ModA [Labilithrix luteola]|uniref:Molybdenum ABC transporter, periplasmic molybdenum-binding protein ModA n=1 Tax=Labilithrix luteola TaxID=1391654 RepID=A0A0K1PIX9_9BACT|nr:molybdate ABC transporter substrate-binding protein [Labilithrix luteola]AKU93477.1 Molybdenum ABC transporter, periplasmic molybdenum-binding protein ModA [Labilithrix luteola]